jgi:hypothetical protein
MPQTSEELIALLSFLDAGRHNDLSKPIEAALDVFPDSMRSAWR